MKMKEQQKMSIHKIYDLGMKMFGHRKERMELFYRLFEPDRKTKILDVGGTPYIWEEYIVGYKHELNIIVLNLKCYDSNEKYKNRFSFVQGNALSLPFEDKSFDIVFCNSLIDHLYSFANQEKCVKEIERVGKQYFVQTGNRRFFVEPHFVTPFIHYLPKEIQKKLARHCTLWGLVARPTTEYINHMIDEIILSTRREFDKLFPDATIVEQRFLGLVKSFIAIKKL